MEIYVDTQGKRGIKSRYEHAWNYFALAAMELEMTTEIRPMTSNGNKLGPGNLLKTQTRVVGFFFLSLSLSLANGFVGNCVNTLAPELGPFKYLNIAILYNYIYIHICRYMCVCACIYIYIIPIYMFF